VSCHECRGLRYLCTKKLGPVETGVVLFPEKIEKSGVFREVLLLTSKWAALRTPRGCWWLLVRFRRVEMRTIELLAGWNQEELGCSNFCGIMSEAGI